MRHTTSGHPRPAGVVTGVADIARSARMVENTGPVDHSGLLAIRLSMHTSATLAMLFIGRSLVALARGAVHMADRKIRRAAPMTSQAAPAAAPGLRPAQ